MKEAQLSLLTLLLESRALQFGEFVLKSGRRSPYFVNLGCLSSGDALSRLGAAYADMIVQHIGVDFDVVFGPAYKGIPIAAATCQALWTRHGKNAGFSADRKEVKDHGDRGRLLGAPLTGNTRVVYVDDVISAGTSTRYTLELFKAHFDCTVAGAVVAVDRQERGNRSTASAVTEIEQDYGITIHAILRIREIVAYLHATPVNGHTYIDDRLRDAFNGYLRQFGAE